MGVRLAGWLAGWRARARLCENGAATTLPRVGETIQQEVKAGGGGDAKDKAGGGRGGRRRGEERRKQRRRGHKATEGKTRRESEGLAQRL